MVMHRHNNRGTDGSDVLLFGLPRLKVIYFFFLPLLRGYGKGTQYLGHPLLGGYKYGDLALQVGGVSRIGTIKYGLKSVTALARTSSNSKLQNYRPMLSSVRALQNNKPATV
jgi:hypothetical protein